MKILSKITKIISFVAFVFSVILISITLNPHIELYDDRFMTILTIVNSLFFIRLFLIPRLAEQMEKKKRQTVELQEQRRQEIKRFSTIDLVVFILTAVLLSFDLAGFICRKLVSYFEYGGSPLERCGLLMYSISMTVGAILAFILPPESSGKENRESRKEDLETRGEDEDTE